MGFQSRELYRTAAKGDRWSLIRDSHTANACPIVAIEDDRRPPPGPYDADLPWHPIDIAKRHGAAWAESACLTEWSRRFGSRTSRTHLIRVPLPPGRIYSQATQGPSPDLGLARHPC